MQIVGIDKSRSTKGEVFFRTDPPLSEKVFHAFQEVWEASKFDFDEAGSMLIWRRPEYVDSEFIRQATIYLTEAENRLQARRNASLKRDDEFLQRLSKDTGVPLV
jgi:hypothetical protein